LILPGSAVAGFAQVAIKPLPHLSLVFLLPDSFVVHVSMSSGNSGELGCKTDCPCWLCQLAHLIWWLIARADGDYVLLSAVVLQWLVGHGRKAVVEASFAVFQWALKHSSALLRSSASAVFLTYKQCALSSWCSRRAPSAQSLLTSFSISPHFIPNPCSICALQCSCALPVLRCITGLLQCSYVP
jgi:hypothetical protein